jgi:O-antigen/teichoic acid export membrane protein
MGTTQTALMDREVTVTPSLRRNFSWSVLGEVTYAGCQWGMIVALAKLGSRELLGQFALALAVTAPVLMFTNLQLRALQATDATPGGGFAKYFTLRLLSCGVALLVIAAVVGLADYPPEDRAGILILGLAKAFEAVSDICHGRLQQLGNLKWVSLSLVLKGLLSLAAVAAGVYWTGRLAPVCLLLLFSWLAVLLAVDVPCVALAGGRRSARPTFALCREPRELKRLLRLGLPLGLTAMLISLNVSLPQLVLERYWHEQAVGAYRALASLMQLSNLPAAALGIAASSRLGYYFATRDRPGLRHLLTRLLGVSFLFGAAGLGVAVFAGRFLLSVFYSTAYAEFHAAFAWLMLAALGVNLCYILNWAAMAARYVNVLIPLHLGLAAVTAVACFGWVPSWGVDGAAWSVAAASACQLVGMALILGHAVRSWSTAAA